MIHQTSPDGLGSAIFSDCMRYRFRLERRFDNRFYEVTDPRWCHWIMLNPSTADAFRNDPTITGCEKRAKAWGYDGVIVTNIFALRSTDPIGLYESMDPIGAGNTESIVEAVEMAAITICGWGRHGALHGRGAGVAGRLAAYALHALKVNKDGSPFHPLYVAHAVQPIPWALDVRDRKTKESTA